MINMELMRQTEKEISNVIKENKESNDIIELLRENSDLVNELLQSQGLPIIKTEEITLDNIVLLRSLWDKVEKIIAYDRAINRLKSLFTIKVNHYF